MFCPQTWRRDPPAIPEVSCRQDTFLRSIPDLQHRENILGKSEHMTVTFLFFFHSMCLEQSPADRFMQQREKKKL